MAFVRDATLQKGLEDVANNCNRLDICSDATEPSNLTNSIGQVALTVGDGNGDYVIADGDVSGRKLAVTAQNVPCTVTATGKWYVVSDGTTVYLSNSIADKAMTSGAVYEFPATDILEIEDPA